MLPGSCKVQKKAPQRSKIFHIISSPSPLNLDGLALIIPSSTIGIQVMILSPWDCMHSDRGRTEGYPMPTIKIHWPPFTNIPVHMKWGIGGGGGGQRNSASVMYYLWSGMANNLWSMMQILKGLEKYEYPGHGGTVEGGKGQVWLWFSTIDCMMKNAILSNSDTK